MQIDVEKIAEVIGARGKVIKKIVENPAVKLIQRMTAPSTSRALIPQASRWQRI